MNSKKLKIIIVDDCEQFRLGLKNYIENECEFEVIGIATNGNEFLQLKNICQADVILMDLMLPEKNGFDTALEATNKYRDLKIIALTENEKKAYLLQMLQSGFSACILKANIFDELLFVVEKVIHGKYHVCRGLQISNEIAN